MNNLTCLSLGGYRCFQQPQRLELQTLTLVLGRNNAGKSALVRALPIFDASIAQGASTPWAYESLEGDGRFKADPRDLFWGSGRRQMWLGLEWEGTCWRLRVELDDAGLRVSAVDLPGGAGMLEAFPRPEHEQFFWSKEDVRDPGLQRWQIHWDGLVPSRLDPALPCLGQLQDLRDRLIGHRDAVQWVSSARARAERFVSLTSPGVWRVWGSGEEVASWLASDRDLLEDVAGWFRHPDIGRDLRVKTVDRSLGQLVLDRLGRAELGIALADTGAGMAQVLPVLTALALGRRRGAGSIVAVEDPESALHEPARVALAQHMCALAAQPDSPCMVVETHSRTFLLGVQLAVARGHLARERVRVAWVEQRADGASHVECFGLDEHGAPESEVMASVLREDDAMIEELARRRYGLS